LCKNKDISYLIVIIIRGLRKMISNLTITKKKIQLELENALQLAKLLETIHYTIKVPSILYHLLQNVFTTIGLCTKVTILPSIMDSEQFIRGSYFTKLKNRITLNHKLDLKNTICVTTIFLLNLN
jgi:hypothetical protein